MTTSGRRACLGKAWLLALLAFLAADAAALDVLAAQRLARQSGCGECHTIYQKKIGPAWKDVAIICSR